MVNPPQADSTWTPLTQVTSIELINTLTTLQHLYTKAACLCIEIIPNIFLVSCVVFTVNYWNVRLYTRCSGWWLFILYYLFVYLSAANCLHVYNIIIVMCFYSGNLRRYVRMLLSSSGSVCACVFMNTLTCMAHVCMCCCTCVCIVYMYVG